MTKKPILTEKEIEEIKKQTIHECKNIYCDCRHDFYDTDKVIDLSAQATLEKITKDKCMVANCKGIPIICIQHVKAARKEGYQQGFYDCKVIEDGNWKKDIENTARKRKEEYGVK